MDHQVAVRTPTRPYLPTRKTGAAVGRELAIVKIPCATAPPSGPPHMAAMNQQDETVQENSRLQFEGATEGIRFVFFTALC